MDLKFVSPNKNNYTCVYVVEEKSTNRQYNFSETIYYQYMTKERIYHSHLMGSGESSGLCALSYNHVYYICLGRCG